MFIISILISENDLELMQSRCPLVAQRDPFPPSKLFQSPCTGTDPIHNIIETTNWREASEWSGYLEFQSHLVFVAIALPIHHCSQCHFNCINSRGIEPGDAFSRICRFKHIAKTPHANWEFGKVCCLRVFHPFEVAFLITSVDPRQVITLQLFCLCCIDECYD